ncbi:unnamed protein product [Arctogadus glacialis]
MPPSWLLRDLTVRPSPHLRCLNRHTGRKMTRQCLDRQSRQFRSGAGKRLRHASLEVPSHCAPGGEGAGGMEATLQPEQDTSGRQHYVKPEQAASEVKGFKDKTGKR